MTSPGEIKKTLAASQRLPKKHRDRDESLTETVKRLKQYERLADRFERLEALVQKISVTEGKTYRLNSV